VNFRLLEPNFSTLVAPGFNALEFSLLGIAVVFLGLGVIAVYITLLPRLLVWAGRLKKRALSAARPVDEAETARPEAALDTETLLAVAVALHLHQFSSHDNRKITWRRHELWDSSWQRAGRFEAMNLHGRLSPPRR
jgi:Na+-transporting methylmalonyl-CoA/oxaloacetate decarboxylase gamma subunit